MKAAFYLDINESKSRIYVTVEINTSKYGDEWDAVRDTDAAEEWIEDIVYFILDYVDDYDIIGEIVDEDGDTLMTFDYDADDDEVYFDW